MFNLRLQHSGLYSCLPFNNAGDGDQASLKIIVDGRLRLVAKSFNRSIVVFRPMLGNLDSGFL